MHFHPFGIPVDEVVFVLMQHPPSTWWVLVRAVLQRVPSRRHAP